jgi:hypothetical protein
VSPYLPSRLSLTGASERQVLNRLTRVVHERGTVVAEGVVGGGLSVIHSRLLQRRPVSLIDLLSPLTAFVVLPYLGGAAVQRELLRAILGTRSAFGRGRWL